MIVAARFLGQKRGWTHRSRQRAGGLKPALYCEAVRVG